MFSKRTRVGFTLIELLVVIAIIAILAAILFPVFARAKQNAQAQKCVSNLKQWGTAFAAYTNDWDSRYPHGGTFAPNEGKYFYDCLAKYVSDSFDLRWCPCAEGKVTKGNWKNFVGMRKGGGTKTTYYYFCRPANPYYNPEPADLCAHRTSEVRASIKPLLGEQFLLHWSISNDERVFAEPFLFCDGHVKAYNITTAGGWPQMMLALYTYRDGRIPRDYLTQCPSGGFDLSRGKAEPPAGWPGRDWNP